MENSATITASYPPDVWIPEYKDLFEMGFKKEDGKYERIFGTGKHFTWIIFYPNANIWEIRYAFFYPKSREDVEHLIKILSH